MLYILKCKITIDEMNIKHQFVNAQCAGIFGFINI